MWNGQRIKEIRKNLKKLFKIDMGKALKKGDYNKMASSRKLLF
jgi:hypothetical protein